MNARNRIFTITAVAAAIMMIAGIALAATNTTSYFYSAGGKNGKVEGSVQVCPDGADSCASDQVGGSVTVKLFRLKDGKWVKLASQVAESDGFLWYAKFTGAPKSGKCKMVAKYSGTDQNDPSKESAKGKCADSDWLR